jgi:hypothetical protein
MQFSKKLRQDWAPILFFGVVVAAKTYYLVLNLSTSKELWGLLGNIGHLADYGQGAAYFMTGSLSYILYYLIALAFDILVFLSFIGRTQAKARPEGFWENVYPLITVSLPVLRFTLLFIPEVRQLVPGYSQRTLELMREISPVFLFYMNLAGTLTGLVGAAFSIWALSYLRRSFGLRNRCPETGYERPLPLGQTPSLRRRDRAHPRCCDPVRYSRRLLPVRGGCRPANRTGQDRGA